MPTEEQVAIRRMVYVIKSTGPEGSVGLPLGDFETRIGGSPFPRLNYSTACALYECARRSGRDASLVDTVRLELVRRNWGHELARGCSQ